MANRVKEEEKNERIIRSLLKLPQNRRCINCNSLGPQYVCTNFWTFVCTTCSGIHREFTHRVKSVSMAKFTSQEVSALQGGGNACAKEIYFKEWDPQLHSVPDNSNFERLREFIKHVYVDRRYTGERTSDKPPRVKMGETEDSYENRRMDTYQGGSRSPPYEDTYERRYSDRPSPGGRSDDNNSRSSYEDRRSPGYEQDNPQYGDFGRSPARTEIVNDWQREDRFGSGKRSEDSISSDGGSKPEGRSPDRQKDMGMSSPPLVRPIRDILGDNVTPLMIIEPPKADGSRRTQLTKPEGRSPDRQKDMGMSSPPLVRPIRDILGDNVTPLVIIEPPKADGSRRTQRTASSSSLASSNDNPVELRRENSVILIDFDAVPEPPIAAVPPQTQQTTVAQPTTSPDADNWACFDFATEAKASQAPPNANSLEFVLSQLSVSATVPGNLAGIPGSGGAPITASGAHISALPSISNPLVSPEGHMSASVLPINGANTFVQLADGGQWPIMHTQQHSLFPATSQFSAQPSPPPFDGASGNQTWNSSLTSNTQGPSSTTLLQTSQPVSKPALEVTSQVVTQPSLEEVKPIGRKELPVDLFAATYLSASVPIPGWQTGAPRGFGFSMQYNIPAPMPTIPQPSKSTNPFDLNNDVSPVHAPTFPSMASMQGALPNMGSPSGLLPTSSLNTPSQSWMPSQSSYLSGTPPQGQSYPSAALPSAYMGQQVPNLPSWQQGVVGSGSEGAVFDSLNSNQQLGGIYSAPSLSSVGGNPFG